MWPFAGARHYPLQAQLHACQGAQMFRAHVFSALASAALLALCQIKCVDARSWIDCVDHNSGVIYTPSEDSVRDDTNDNGACEGYGYNYPGNDGKTSVAEFSWKIHADQILDDSAQICQYRQKDATYNEWRRQLHAQPGDTLYLGYVTDTHVQNEEDDTSVWGVYWSGEPDVELTKPSELTFDRLVDGNMNAFDEGYCKTSNTNDDTQTVRSSDYTQCVGSFSIPTNTKPGRYQMVWYWTTWTNDEDESTIAFSSCFDVIIDGSRNGDDTLAIGTGNNDRCGVQDDEPTHSPIVTHSTPLQTTVTPTLTPTPTFAPLNVVTPASFAVSSASSPYSAPLAAVTYNGVGGSGMYGKVTTMQCAGSSRTCAQTDFPVSGPIAPFDEDLSLNLRGPLNVDAISVFAFSDASAWSQVSSYSKQTASSQNMVFLNNKGDPLKSGVFDYCNGNSQSYATADGKDAASGSTPFSGVLDDGVEINVMSSTNCEQSGTCGVTRGVAHEGWEGTNKIFMIKASMPLAPSGGKDIPAIWLLNGQIVRTAQYGCNCRGVGDNGKWKGGCGEIDVAEVLSGDTRSLSSTIYSFKGSRGADGFMPRPVENSVVFVVILSEKATTGSTNLGMVQILVMKPEDVDMSTPPPSQQVDQWLAYRNGPLVNFDI